MDDEQSRQRRQRDATRSFDPRRIDWRVIRWEQIDRCIARFEGGARADLLGSAADSPGGVHRLPSLTICGCDAWRRRPAHTGPASRSPSDATPHRPAISAFCIPSAASSTIRARLARPDGMLGRRASSASPLAEVHEQGPGLLGCPRPCGVGGNTQDVHAAGLDLHDEEDIQAL